MKVIKSKTKANRPNSSKRRKPAPYEHSYSAAYKGPPKSGFLGNSVGLYNGNFDGRNSCFVNQNTLSLNIGGGTFNHSTKANDNFMSKTVGNDNFKNSQNLGSMKSKSAVDKIGGLNKSGPIKATVSTEKARLNKYEFLSNKYSENTQKKVTKPISRDKRPHSSTFIGNTNKENNLYSKLMTTNPKPKSSNKAPKEGVKKKVNKRVRSASPGGLQTFLNQKQPTAVNKSKPQRLIGGHLYQPSFNGFMGES